MIIKNISEWKAAMRQNAKNEKIGILSNFFKTGKGQYGEGDVFIGLSVPDNRRIAGLTNAIPLDAIPQMLSDPVHEYRLGALLALVARYKKAGDAQKEEILDYYLSHTANINNWDLVDLSAPYIVGAEALRTGRCQTLYSLAESNNMWERRIAVVANLTLIRKGILQPAMTIVEKLLFNKEDLMQKANGWILREVGKKNEPELLAFLERYAATMPRTTLRYSIERLKPTQKADYMGRKKLLVHTL